MRRRRLHVTSTDPTRPQGDIRATNRQDSIDAAASAALVSLLCLRSNALRTERKFGLEFFPLHLEHLSSSHHYHLACVLRVDGTAKSPETRGGSRVGKTKSIDADGREDSNTQTTSSNGGDRADSRRNDGHRTRNAEGADDRSKWTPKFTKHHNHSARSKIPQ